MAFRDRDRKDFNAGFMYICIGGFFAGFATNYPMGSAVRMGPAYFPTILGALLVMLGLILVFRSFFMHGSELPSKTHWRPLGFILGAVVFFAFLIDRAGLVASSVVMMLMGSMGGWQFRWKEQLVTTVVMTGACIGIFYYALGLPFRLFPWS
jgi:hypothetical protein